MLNAEILNLWIKFKVLPKVSTRYCLALILRNRNKKDIRIVNRFIGAKQKQEEYQNSKHIRAKQKQEGYHNSKQIHRN